MSTSKQKAETPTADMPYICDECGKATNRTTNGDCDECRVPATLAEDIARSLIHGAKGANYVYEKIIPMFRENKSLAAQLAQAQNIGQQETARAEHWRERCVELQQQLAQAQQTIAEHERISWVNVELSNQLGEARQQLAQAQGERDELKTALEKLLTAVKLKWLAGVTELVTVEDVIKGMHSVADKLESVSLRAELATVRAECERVREEMKQRTREVIGDEYMALDFKMREELASVRAENADLAQFIREEVVGRLGRSDNRYDQDLVEDARAALAKNQPA